MRPDSLPRLWRYINLLLTYLHLWVHDEVYPVIMPTRRMPLAVRPKQKAELERMTEAGIIVPVTELTPWVSQIVATPKKNGDIGIDLRELNKALIRERFTLPIFDDAIQGGPAKVRPTYIVAGTVWYLNV